MNVVRPNSCLACEKSFVKETQVFEADMSTGSGKVQFYLCLSCHSLTCEPLDRTGLYEDRNSENYAENISDFLQLLKIYFFKFSYSKMLKEIDKGTVMIDYGCGSGELCNALLNMGFTNVIGVDLQPTRPSSLDSKIKYLSTADFESLQPKKSVLFARHVLEHFDDPTYALENMSSRLLVGSLMVIEVPNANSVFRKWMGSRWPGYFAPYHTAVFSKDGLSRIFQKSGLDVLAIREVDSPILGYFLLKNGVPRFLAKVISVGLYPMLQIVSLLWGSKESILLKARVSGTSLAENEF